MKIAIKANPSRGKEIISLLVNLGGINKRNWNGDGNIDTYYIDKNNIIQYDRVPADYKAYTLEEFEKEGKFTETCLNGIKQDIVYDPDYWTKLEHQYAGMAMQQLVSIVNAGYEYVYEETAIIAMNFAHSLVQKLKESK